MSHPLDTTAAPPRERSRPAPRQLSDRAAAGILVLLALLAFAPWWLGGRLLAPLDVLHETFAPWNSGDTTVVVHNHFTSDAVTQYIVYRAIAARSYAEDGALGWSDLTNAGRPEYANTMATYGDWTMQLHRFLEFWTAWHIGLLAQLILAALGMYVLLRAQRIMPLLALTCAVAFAASTPFVHTLYHRWHLGAFAWVPWLVWALQRHAAGARAARVAAPLFLAFALVGGSLQTSVFVVFVLLSLWLGTWLDLQDRGVRMRWTRDIAVCAALGAALAAFVLVPAVLTYLDGVALHGERSSLGYRHGWQQPLRALLFIPLQALPTLLGTPRSLDLAKLFYVDLTSIAFFGFLPTVVAMRCAFWKQTPLPARILIVLGLLVPLTPLVGPLYHRVQILFVFGGIWAFAHYWQHADVARDRFWRALLAALLLLGVVWLCAGVIVSLLHDRIVALLQERVAAVVAGGGGGRLDGFSGWLQQRAARLPAELMPWHPRQLVAIAGVVTGMAAVRLRARERHRRAAVLLLAAVTVELAVLGSGFVTYVDAERYPPYPARGDIEQLRELAAGGRVHVATSHDGAALFFPSNTLAMYGVPTIEQFETVAFAGMWQAAGARTDAGTLGRMSVTHAVAAPGTAVAPGWRALVQGGAFDVWANEHAVPRYLALPTGVAAGPFLDDVQAGERRAAEVRVDSATMNRRVLWVPAGTAQLRVSDNWGEGWSYRAGGGAWRAVARAADRSMLLSLSPAAEPVRVELVYRPQRRRAGRFVTMLAALLLVPMVLLPARAGSERGLKRE